MGKHASDVYLCYTLPPDEAIIPPDVEERLLKSGSWDEWNDAHARANAMRARKTSSRGLLYWDNHVLSQIDIPLSRGEAIDSLYMDNKGIVYLAGGAGVIAAGSYHAGFPLLAAPMSKERIISIVKFRDEVYFLNKNNLMKIEGEKIQDIDLPFIGAWPFKIEATRRHLFYFDCQARVALFDGKGWSEITLPPALLKRDFMKP